MNADVLLVSGRAVRVNSDVAEFKRLVREHGALVNLPLAGILLGVSRAQIYRLWDERRFCQVCVRGFRFVPFREVLAYARLVRRRDERP